IEAYRDSIVPNIHADEKLETFLEASVAWLFNAYRIDPENGPTYRGDLHMGLIGDPGLGKSTILQSLAAIAPKSEFRSGTGLSAVGLTAAAVQEEFAGKTEWTLQPGVLPRANGGHCIIDEVDDVVDEKTKKMHDALEGEQMVKVDKAGIEADLPSRTALFASGNPTDGRFDRYAPIADQIDLDPALFDRMDLVFALQDEVDAERDANKAGHALDAWDDITNPARPVSFK
ncbi:MAG: AAA family ATPase, partial [Desulfococcaceae bacterium]